MRLLTRLIVLHVFISLQLQSQQTTSLSVPDNLVTDNIPPIPISVVESVGRYTEFRSASFAAWFPDRHEMLIITRFGDVPQVHHVKFPGGARTQMTFFPDRLRWASFGPSRSDYFLFSKDVGGGEWFQSYRYDLATGAITLITDGKSRNSTGVWSTKGDKIAYSSTKRNGKDSDFYITDPVNPSTERMLAQLDRGEGWTVQDWSPDDAAVLAHEEISINESSLWLFEVASGKRELLTPKTGEQVAYGGGQFSRDGKGVYCTTDRESEFRRLALIDRATKKITYLTSHIPWDTDEFELSPDGRTIAIVSNEDGVDVLRLLNTTTGKELPVPKMPAGTIGGIRWHKDNTLLGFTLASAHSSSDVYSLEVATGKLDRWTMSETGGLPVETFADPELVKWKSFDGRTISGFLYRPPRAFTGKRPVMIMIHGGPEAQFRPGFIGRSNYYLNEMGVAMIMPNIRGSSGYGKSFLKLDNGFLREDSYKDIGALIDWIGTRPELDGERVLVTGGSYGGHMTLAVATLYDDRIRCSVDIVGMSNLVTFLEHTEAYRRDLRRVEYGDERDPKMRAFLEKTAPLNNADRITKPMFIIQGKNDPRVPASEAMQMMETLKKNKTTAWFLMAKDEGHGFAKKKNQDFQFYATVQFIREYLLK